MGNTGVQFTEMKFSSETILSILDQCCDAFTFPMLDNGYVYLAATRLSLYRSDEDWAMVIEVFGFSPRAGLPDTHIHTFASRLHNRDSPEKYISRERYEQYLVNNPHNESRLIFPVDEGPWQDPECLEFVADNAQTVSLRGVPLSVPALPVYARHEIILEEPPRVQVFELCRFFADVARDQVLATEQERRVSVRPEMIQILQLEEWNHPNIVDESERPSGSETFQQLSKVLITGQSSHYRPTLPPNTHWRNWPESGLL